MTVSEIFKLALLLLWQGIRLPNGVLDFSKIINSKLVSWQLVPEGRGKYRLRSPRYAFTTTGSTYIWNDFKEIRSKRTSSVAWSISKIIRSAGLDKYIVNMDVLELNHNNPRLNKKLATERARHHGYIIH